MSKDLADKAESLGLTKPDGIVWREKYEQLEKFNKKIITAFRLNMMRVGEDYSHETFDQLIEVLRKECYDNKQKND